ncbi:hypothetical protein NDU88_002709 [Pleurodeles waltl]|uniref:Uncharacterized protein n=1 Tax=Pleurodeles waltl TaxID=8319 RepID=A0AAV7UAM9_PLEWA|nr:hypothetical protein NDU88_002709 [Pleurodeles waltl]
MVRSDGGAGDGRALRCERGRGAVTLQRPVLVESSAIGKPWRLRSGGGRLPKRERRSGSVEVPQLGTRDGPAALICHLERHEGDSRCCIDPAAQEAHWTRRHSPEPGV